MKHASIVAVMALACPLFVQAQEPSIQQFRKAVAAADIRKIMAAADTDMERAWVNTWNAGETSSVAVFLEKPFDLTVAAPTLEELEAIRESIPSGMGGYVPFDLGALGTAAGASGVLLPSQAAVLRGLAGFLVERAKDEVVYAFVVRLQDADYSCFVEAAFQRSLRALEAMEPQTFQTAMPLLRTAVQTDLNELTPRLGQREFREKACLSGQASIDLQVGSALYPVVRSIGRGSSPAMALAELARLDTSKVSHKDIVTGLNLIGAVARDYTLYGDDMRTRITERSGLVPQYYLAFLGRDLLESVHPALGTEAQAAMNRLKGVQGQLVAYVLHLDATNDALPGLSSDTAAVSAGVVVRTGLSLLEVAVPLIPTPSARIDSVRTALADVAYLNDLMVAGDYSGVVLWVAEEVNLWNQARDIRFLGFAASLAAARSAEEVEQVLHTAAAPIGAYRAKRNQAGEWGPRSASVVGYVGGGVGGERGGSGSATHLGASLPFGVEISWGAPFGAVSFFAPLLDLGMIASLRLGDDSAETMPEVGFRQVFAPGLFFLTHPWPDLPLTFGVGVQAVNDLRKTEGTDATFDVTRWSIIGGIDATIFNLIW